MHFSAHKKEYKNDRTQHFVSRFYALLSVAAVLIMISAAYITYGYQVREVVVQFEEKPEKIQEKRPELAVNADLSRVPSDHDLKTILNDVVPHRCDDCDDDPLDCLDEYTMDKVLVRGNDGHQLLYVNIFTGKEPQKYTVVLDLDMHNALVKKEGSIDRKECITLQDESEDVDPYDVSITLGEDPNDTDYIKKQAN